MTGRTHVATLAAAVTAGVQGVIILVISKASLPADGFAPLAQLWAIWAVSAASFNYGCQQWAAVRPIGAGALATAAGRHLLAALSVIGLFVGTTTYLARTDLFASNAAWWPFFAALLPLGTAAVGLNRGELARLGHPIALAFVIATENTLRIVATVVLVIVDAPAWTYGAALILGFAVAAVPHPSRSYHERLDLRPLITAVASGMAAHTLLFGAPLILAMGGGSPDDVVLLFLVLSTVRAPFVLLQGLIPQLAVRFGRGHDDLRSTVRTLITIGHAAAAFAFVGGTVLGDAIVGRIFSIQGELSAWIYGVVAATAMVSVALTIVTVRLVASDHTRPLLIAWTVPVVATIIAVVVGSLDRLAVVAPWILGSHLVVAAIVLIATVQPVDRRSAGSARTGDLNDRPHLPPAAHR